MLKNYKKTALSTENDKEIKIYLCT